MSVHKYTCLSLALVTQNCVASSGNPAIRVRICDTYTCVRYYYACAPLIDWTGQATPSVTGLPLMLRSQASYVMVSGFRAALDLDTYPLSNLIRPRCAERAKRGRGKPVLIMHIGFFACFHAISLERSRFSKIASFFFLPL